LFPGLRLGFVIVPRWCRDHLIAKKQESDRHCNLLGQHTLAAFIREGHMGRHVRRMRDLYAERRALIEAGLDGPLSRWLERVPGSAGLHVAAYLRRPTDDLILSKWLRTLGIHCEALGAYTVGPTGAPGLAFGYGAIATERIGEGLRLLERELDGKG
jgi:GntR family transcriptional regulator/MocR family aminotransferase